MTYNGWANRQTWLLNVWADPNEFEQEAQELLQDEHGLYNLSQLIRERYEKSMFDVLEPMQASLWHDLLMASMSQVDWRQLAEHKLLNAANAALTKEDV